MLLRIALAISAVWIAGLLGLWLGRADVNLLGIDLEQVLRRLTTNCHADPTHPSCLRQPLPPEVVQGAVDFPIVVPCWVPAYLEQDPAVTVERPGVVKVIYAPTRTVAGTHPVNDLLIISEARYISFYAGPESMPQRIGDVDVFIAGDEAKAKASWYQNGTYFGVQGPVAKDDAGRLAAAMISGCGS
jgi:hypothetical protein